MAPKLYTNCSPTLHKRTVAATAPTAHISSTGNGHVVGIAAPAFPEMLTRNRAIWISAKNVLSLHCSGADLRQTRGCSGVFCSLWSSKKPRGASRRQHLVKTTKHLVKITKHLAKTTKHLVKNTKEAVLRRGNFEDVNLPQKCCQRL